ncbi:hypothetical protein ERICV_03842 [Paenibacillus larvae subsp. larvae]|uniref:Uncharacterized protein n=1 Tax=Paenibacillus larvae subsp. larvae TaxID=147375 RepID=A0A6C0QWV0_9BACL|nr:hypothetical protein ERICV_03842 [Paenibacillus larvae subsp. larvae]
MESCRRTGQNTTAEAIPIIETILASGSEQAVLLRDCLFVIHILSLLLIIYY